MKSFEDLDFYCLDNLPPILLSALVDLIESAGFTHVAISLDVRSHGTFGEALEAVDAVIARGVPAEMLFLEASDETLVRRYSETRRKHPLAETGSLTEAIAAERAALEPLRTRAAAVWDTTGQTLGRLKARIAQTYAQGAEPHTIQVVMIAFGYKHGLPLEADLVFDVRFLPNPNYIDSLRPQTGLAPEVRAYLEAQAETTALLAHLTSLLDYLMPLYVAEGKSTVTIAVGCTGGRHRSVYIASRLGAYLAAGAQRVVYVNRDIDR